MILFKYNHKKDEKPYHDMGIRSWFETIEIEWFQLSLRRYLSHKGHKKPYVITEHHICIDSNFKLGQYHGYYDGPHCSYNFGFLHIYLEPANCEKCF